MINVDIEVLVTENKKDMSTTLNREYRLSELLGANIVCRNVVASLLHVSVAQSIICFCVYGMRGRIAESGGNTDLGQFCCNTDKTGGFISAYNVFLWSVLVALVE